mgnify:CR=1 FL=1
MDNKKEFKDYVIKRKKAFEKKYRILAGNKILTDKHYVNNLKFLDDTSQYLIRHLNSKKIHIRDKLLTVLVFRILGNKSLAKSYSNKHKLYDMDRIYLLGKALGQDKKYSYRYTSLLKKKPFENRDDCFFACVETFIESLPDDNFYKWKTSKIFKHLVKSDIMWLTESMAYQLATDIAFINELKITLDFIPYISSGNKKILCYILDQKNISMSQYKDFVLEIMQWYSTLKFADNIEKLIVPTDIAQMLIGFKRYKGYGDSNTKRNGTKRIKRISGLVITGSINEFFKQLQA